MTSQTSNCLIFKYIHTITPWHLFLLHLNLYVYNNLYFRGNFYRAWSTPNGNNATSIFFLSWPRSRCRPACLSVCAMYQLCCGCMGQALDATGTPSPQNSYSFNTPTFIRSLILLTVIFVKLPPFIFGHLALIKTEYVSGYKL